MQPQDAPQEKSAEESIYRVRANPYSDSPENSHILQEYVTQENGFAKLGDILYKGTMEKCSELLARIDAGELTQGEVKELYTQAREAAQTARPESILQDKVTLDKLRAANGPVKKQERMADRFKRAQDEASRQNAERSQQHKIQEREVI